MAKVHSEYGVFAQGQMDKFVKDLQNQIDEQYLKGTEQNMEDAIDVIEQRSQELVPEDTGATKRSWFRYVESDQGTITGTFGYDENGELDYVPLIYVNPFDFNWQKEGAEDYWLQKAVAEKNNEIIQQLSKNAKTN